MSFIDDILGGLGDVVDWATGSSTSAGMARAAALAYLLKQVTDSINKDNKPDTTDNSNKAVVQTWTRTQIDPSTENTIPLLYGSGHVGGVITDAELSSDNMTMWYCITICEKTGPLMSTNIDSEITFKNIYWNDMELILQADGITAAKLVNAAGDENTEVNGLIEVYLFNNGSDSPCYLNPYLSGNIQPAYMVFPSWTGNHTMDELVFAIVKVTYDATKNTTGIGDMRFHLENSLSLPGDVLHDYMTNIRYGAGINSEELYNI